MSKKTKCNGSDAEGYFVYTVLSGGRSTEFSQPCIARNIGEVVGMFPDAVRIERGKWIARLPPSLMVVRDGGAGDRV